MMTVVAAAVLLVIVMLLMIVVVIMMMSMVRILFCAAGLLQAGAIADEVGVLSQRRPRPRYRNQPWPIVTRK